MKNIHKLASLLLIAAMCFAMSLQTNAQEPLIPINTNFSHWDHHWIMWTPQHPVYEAIEAMTVDNPKSPESKLIRIFFTERAGSKKQVYYFSDPAVARTWQGEAYYREIEYKTDGVLGRPLGLHLKFKDKDDAVVEWTMKFEAARELSREWQGLKAQGGHAAQTVFLLFYNGPNATTTRSELVIGGKDYSSRIGQLKPYHAAYSFNAYTAVIAYGRSSFVMNNNELRNSSGRVFKRKELKSGALYQTNRFGFQESGQIEFQTNLQGEVLIYRHRQGEHVFRIEFAPALPTIGSAQSGQMIRYTVSIDDHEKLFEGVASIKKEENLIKLDWQHQSPAWTKEYGFQSIVQPTSTGYSLEVVRKR